MVHEPPSALASSVLLRRAGLISGELALLGVVWYLMVLDPPLVGAIAAVIIVSGVMPTRFTQLAGGLGLCGLAALVYLHYGSERLGAVLAVFGVVTIGVGLAQLRKRRG